MTAPYPTRKPRLRLFNDGKVFRFWPAALGCQFPTGPYDKIEDALAFSDFFTAARACGYKPIPPRSYDQWA